MAQKSSFQGTTLARGECRGELLVWHEAVTVTKQILLIDDFAELPELVDGVGYVVKWAGTTSHRVLDARARGRPVMRLSPSDFDELAALVASGNSRWATGHLVASRDAAHLYNDSNVVGPLARETADERPRISGVATYANIDNAEQCALAVARGAHGVGMWRLERFLISRRARALVRDLIGRATRGRADTAVGDVAGMIGHELIEMTSQTEGFVCMRLIDADYSDLGVDGKSGDRHLGVRGIRLSLTNPRLLDAQILALRAVRGSEQVRILVPLITHAAELGYVRDRMRRLLGRSAAHVKIGYTIETPRSLVMLGHVRSEIDFVSIGTNDLVQFFWAADRDYSEATWLDEYEKLGVAVFNPYRETDRLLVHDFLAPTLRSIKASRTGIEVGMSGDYARLASAVELLAPDALDYVSLSLADL